MFVLDRLRNIYCASFAVTTMIICGLPCFILCMISSAYISIEYIQIFLWLCVKVYFRMILYICGTNVRVTGLTNLNKHSTYIYMCNHTSVYDIPVIYHVLPSWTVAICKSSLSHIPIFGWLIQIGGCIFVDRNNTQASINALENGLCDLKRYPKSVLAFPEGKIPIDDGLHPFKVGVFIFAVQSGIPVVPVSISGCRQLFGREFNIFSTIKPGCVTVTIGEPIATNNLNVSALSRIVYEKIKAQDIKQNLY